MVFNEEDEEYYLWSRRNLLTRKVTLSDLMKLMKKDKRLARLTPDQAILRLPVSVRAPAGLSWSAVLKAKVRVLTDQMDSIGDEANPTSQSPGGTYEVKEFIGWTVYPVAGSRL